MSSARHAMDIAFLLSDVSPLVMMEAFRAHILTLMPARHLTVHARGVIETAGGPALFFRRIRRGSGRWKPPTRCLSSQPSSTSRWLASTCPVRPTGGIMGCDCYSRRSSSGGHCAASGSGNEAGQDHRASVRHGIVGTAAMIICQGNVSRPPQRKTRQWDGECDPRQHRAHYDPPLRPLPRSGRDIRPAPVGRAACHD